MDDRPLDDPAAAINALRADLDDLKATLLAQLARRPVGDFEVTLRATAKPGTLICDGSPVSRTTYAALWAWAQAQGLVTSGLFTVGDNSTTFGLPDFRGHVLRGKSSAEVIGSVSGADTKAIGTANLPAHDHGSTGSHIHDSANGEMGSSGSHGGHFPGSSFLAAAGSDLGLAAWNSGGSGAGGHSHFFTFDILAAGGHTHATVGSGTAFDVRQLGKAVNFLVWH